MVMKKAAGVLSLGLAPVAAVLAQSSVTLYGVIDNGFMSDKTEGNSAVSAINGSLSSAARWGIRGVEDLGGGWKASFRMESGITPDNGALGFGGRLFGRAAYVALGSNTFGELQLGRMANLGLMYTAGIMSPFGPSFQRSSVTTTAAYNTGDFGTSARVDNAVYYHSPVIGGFQGALGYSMNVKATEVPGHSNNERMVDAGLRYTGGPLRVAASYQYVLPSHTASVPGKPSNLQVGATYDLGTLALYAGYGRLRNPRVDPGNSGVTGFAATHDTDNSYNVGVKMPLGPGDLLVGYQRATGSKIEGYAIAYRYALSKRTWLYAYANRSEVTTFTAAGAKADDQWRRQFAVGIGHNF